MNKIRAKKAFLEKKAEEAAEAARKAAAEQQKLAKLGDRNEDGTITVDPKDLEKNKGNPLMQVVTEEQLSASGADRAAMLELRTEAEKAIGNLDPSERRYNNDEAVRSIHFPFATGPQMATFFDRMRLTKRSFYYRESTNSEVKLVEPDFVDTDEDAVEKARRDKPGLFEKGLLNEEEVKATNKRQRDQWYGLCRMEYVSRQQQYRKKRANAVSTFKFIIPTVVAFLCFLAVCWPLWDYLLDIETNNHYATLGLPGTATSTEVKKAYRAMSKQWHPDHNPDCGQKCRDMMMKIQEAYDKLNARGAGGEEALEQQRETQLKQALHQIRNLVFFKAYSIAFYCAEYLNMLVLSIPFLKGTNKKSKIESAIRIFVVIAFSAAEVILVTGFNIIIIMQIFYFAVNMVTGSASKRQMEKWIKRSNFDFKRDLVFFVLPSLAVHGVYFFFFEKYPKYDVFIFDCALGFAFVASHLAKFSPNLFDNWALKKCSLTTQYMKPTLTRSGKMGLQYTRWNFWSTEFSIIIDDLFAYTSSIPSVFRLIVILIHCAYLVQLRLLPWDAPVTGRLGQRYRKQKEASEAAAARRNAIASSPLDDSDDEDEGGDFAERLRNQAGNVPLWRAKNKGTLLKGTRPLSDTEREWFTNVDATGVLWMDIPYTKYAPNLAKFRTPAIANTNTQLCMTPDLQDILIVYVNKNRVIPQQIKDPQLLELAKSQPITPQFRVCEKIHDPEMCRVLYRDMKNTIFLNVGQPASAPGEGPPGLREDPLSLVYRLCGGPFGYDQLDNNEVREVSLLKGGIACAGVRAIEPEAVSFALSSKYAAAVSAELEGDVKSLNIQPYKDYDPANRRPWRIVFNLFSINVIISVLSLLAVFGLYRVPEAEVTLRNPTGGTNRQAKGHVSTVFDPFLTPLCAQKYTGLLPGDHVLNAFAAGAIVIPPMVAYDQKLPIPVFVPDMWDALRQLSLFTTSSGNAQQQQQEYEQQQQQQQQKQKKGGGKKRKS